jgi:ribose 5-phosphate isomerase B
VLAIGGRVVGTGLADEILELWLTTPFEGGRHQERVDQITELERTGGYLPYDTEAVSR